MDKKQCPTVQHREQDIQYPEINHNGKEYKSDVYMCITETLRYTAKINTTF